MTDFSVQRNSTIASAYVSTAAAVPAAAAKPTAQATTTATADTVSISSEAQKLFEQSSNSTTDTENQPSSGSTDTGTTIPQTPTAGGDGGRPAFAGGDGGRPTSP